MTVKTLLAALALLLSATIISLAQSLPNYGPNAPATGDSFGKPPSGTNPPRALRQRYSAYAYERRLHRRHWRDRQPY
jgi:hypothetical protein